MRLSFPTPPSPVDSNQIDGLSSSKPTTLLLRTHRPYIFNYWTLNDRLRLENAKLSRRQQSSCRIAFYSLWLCIIASVLIIIIYRFTDECPFTINRKQFFTKCLRHWLFILAICISIFACSGVLFGACRYFRSQPHTFQPDIYFPNKHQNILPMTNISYPTSIPNGTPILSFRNNEQINLSSRRMIPPFDYDELPPESKSPINKNIFFSSSNSSVSSPQTIFYPTPIKNDTNRILNSKMTSISEDNCSRIPTSYRTCICGRDVWERQQTLPTFL